MIKINLEKAKDIAHKLRREAREKEFEPFDQIISKQIPGNKSEEAEAQRVLIRAKYEAIQAELEEASDANELKQIMKKFDQKA